MTEKLLLETIERIGAVTQGDLALQTGAVGPMWHTAAVRLLEKKEVFLCRLDHGMETLISKHLLFCMQAVYTEPTLSPDAQALVDWLSDNELAAVGNMRRVININDGAFNAAFGELQYKLCIAPLMAKRVGEEVQRGDELSQVVEFLWVTLDYWMLNVQRPSRYNDLAYCLSELRRLLRTRFSKKELDALIYQGKL